MKVGLCFLSVMFLYTSAAATCDGKAGTTCVADANCGHDGCFCSHCLNNAAACTERCEVAGFFTNSNKCVKCTDVTHCVPGKILCTEAKKSSCGECKDGFFRESDSTNNVHKCTACNGGFFAGTTGYEKVSCTASTAGSTDVECKTGYFKTDKTTGADAKCTACTAITDCSSGKTTCTEPKKSSCEECVDGYFRESDSTNNVHKCTPCFGFGVAGTAGYEKVYCTASTAGSTDVECETGYFKTDKTTGADAMCTACTAISDCSSGKTTCTEPKKSSCEECVDGYFRESDSTNNVHKCTACSGEIWAGTAGYEKVSCTASTAGSTDVECKTGYFKTDKTTGADAKCTACTAITDCSSGKTTCTEPKKSSCEECVDGYFRESDSTNNVHKCTPCFGFAVAGTAGYEKVYCTAITQGSTDVECKTGYFKTDKTTGTDAKCTTCASASKSCADVSTQCTAKNGAITAGTKCLKWDELSKSDDSNSRYCMIPDKLTATNGFVLSNSGVCTNFAAKGTQSGGCKVATCAKIPGVYEFADSSTPIPNKTCRPCSDYKTGDVNSCLECTGSSCAKGTCKTSTNEFKDGKCTAKQGGGGGGGGTGTGNKTGNNTNTTSSAPSLASLTSVVVALALLA